MFVAVILPKPFLHEIILFASGNLMPISKSFFCSEQTTLFWQSPYFKSWWKI